MYYLCEKYYKPITVQYYITSCVHLIPRLTFLDLRTSWTYECTLRMDLVCMQGAYCIAKPHGNHKPKIYNRYKHKKEKAITSLKIDIKSQEKRTKRKGRKKTFKNKSKGLPWWCSG